jgi:hypothetical protein
MGSIFMLSYYFKDIFYPNLLYILNKTNIIPQNFITFITFNGFINKFKYWLLS